MEPQEVIDQIVSGVLEMMDFDLDEVKDVEENCGSTWIILNDGRTFSLMLIECEPQNEEDATV